MPAILTSNPLAVQFDVRPTFDKFVLADLNGLGGIYAVNLIPASGVKGNFTITAPDGTVVYNNTSFASPDYVGNVSYFFSTVPLPLNADGSYVAGIYTVVMRTEITDGSNPTYVLTYTGTYNFQYVRPVVCITQTVDCVSPLFTSADETSYDVAGQTSVVVTRAHSIIYPPGSAGDGSPTTGTTQVLTSSLFYNGPQTTEISTNLMYTFAVSSGSVPTFNIRDLVSGVKYVEVDCTFICKIYCCLRTLYNTAQGYKGNNNLLAAKYSALFAECMGIVELALTAISCGNQNDVNGYLNTIKDLANCTDDCSCTDTPSLVTGLAGSGVNVVVASGGAPLSVTSSTVGTTTTWTITFDPALVTKINNSYNTVVVGDAGIAVVDSGIVAGVRTFTLDSSALTKDRLEFKAVMTWANPVVSPASLTIAISDVVIVGTKFQTPTIEKYDNANPSWTFISNRFRVHDFYVAAPTDNYKLVVGMTREGWPPLAGNPAKFNALGNVAVKFTLDMFARTLVAPGEFYFRFLSEAAGSMVVNTNGGMAGQTQILSFVITE